MKCSIRSGWLALGLIAGTPVIPGCVEDSDCYLTRTCPGPDASVEAAADEGDEGAVTDDDQTVPSKPEPAGSAPAGTANDGPDITLPLVPLPAATATEDGGGQDAVDATMPNATAPAEPMGTTVFDAAVVDTPIDEDAGDSGGTQPEPEPMDYCAENNGGCDPLAECGNVDEGAECGACPAGYVGDGSTGCTPTLLGLDVSHGSLTSELDPGVDQYEVIVPVFIEYVVLSPRVPEGASVTIRGAAVASGGSWTSPRLVLGDNEFSLTIEQAGQPSGTYSLVVTRGPEDVAYIKASNAGEWDLFGGENTSVALSADGTTLAVSSIGESSAANGVGGDETNDDASSAGAVYVFGRNESDWIQQAYLKASNTGSDDRFGSAIAISGDGATLVVGAPYEDSDATGAAGGANNNNATSAGAAYVFKRTGNGWSQQAYIKASNTTGGDQFGVSVALSTDGDTLAVGAMGEDSSATGVSGSQNNHDAEDSGAAYVFVRTGASWSQQAYVKASNTDAQDRFGRSVTLSGDGNTLAVGAHGEDSELSGTSVSPSSNTYSDAGAAYVFERTGTTWSQKGFLKAANAAVNDYFGWPLILSADGSTLAVGATATGRTNSVGVVCVFVRWNGEWTQQATLAAWNADTFDNFASRIALSGTGNLLAVGASSEDGSGLVVSGDPANNDASGSGAVYLFTRSGSEWSKQAYVKASNTEAGDAFGASVALSDDGTTLAVGARSEASSATGSAGTGQSDNSAPSAGAVYVYR